MQTLICLIIFPDFLNFAYHLHTVSISQQLHCILPYQTQNICLSQTDFEFELELTFFHLIKGFWKEIEQTDAADEHKVWVELLWEFISVVSCQLQQKIF